MGQNITPPATTSGIKVLDRAMLILVTIGEKPRSLTELCEATGLPRATAHRLASALETHHILTRTADGRWTIGAVLTSLGARSATTLVDAATPIMAALMADTGESVQLYQLAGAHRVCIAAQEPVSGLQNTVPTGSRLPLTAGSAAKIFLAYSSPALKATIMAENPSFTLQDIDEARDQGWAESISEREVGLASLSAPVFNGEGLFVAALSISGPAERLKPHPGALWADHLVAAATQLSAAL